jgi:hypothetical protein
LKKVKEKEEQYPLEISCYLLQPTSSLSLSLSTTTAAAETKDVISNFFHESHLHAKRKKQN